jgi:Co/Zn/Cd efflux system component
VSEPQLPAAGPEAAALRRAVRLVAGLNPWLLCRRIRGVAAHRLGLFYADSIDFLEDAALNFLVLAALGSSASRRALVAMLLAALLLVPSAFTLWAAWQKLMLPLPPAPIPLSAAGAGALLVNFYCAYVLAPFRARGGSLMRAAYLSARNDAAANLAIIAAGLLTLAMPSAWPDLVVGIGIFLMNIDAAREVFVAARRERPAIEA